MSSFDPKVYLKVFRVKKALVFDLGGLMVRMFSTQVVLGVVTMLTLAGWSFLKAGSVSSVVAISAFLISPQISRLMDLKGQSRIMPFASAAALIGLSIMIGALITSIPDWLCYPAAVLMGCCPNAPSMARTRWTYLTETGLLGKDAPELKTVFSYEGVLDDASFMIGPSSAIVLSSLLFPTAGMIFGGCMLLLGSILMLAPKSTEPVVGWMSAEASHVQEKTGEKKRSMMLSSGLVRGLFLGILAIGLFYSMHDTVLIAVGEERGMPAYISFILMAASLLSMICGFIFGMINLKAKLPTQLLVLGLCYGFSYGLMGVVTSMPALTLVCILSAVFFGPYIITLNTMCERGVPSDRLTESLTWINSGYTCGSAVVPILAGLAIDAFGGTPCLKICGILALMVAVYVVAIQPYLRSKEYF